MNAAFSDFCVMWVFSYLVKLLFFLNLKCIRNVRENTTKQLPSQTIIQCCCIERKINAIEPILLWIEIQKKSFEDWHSNKRDGPNKGQVKGKKYVISSLFAHRKLCVYMPKIECFRVFFFFVSCAFKYCSIGISAHCKNAFSFSFLVILFPDDRCLWSVSITICAVFVEFLSQSVLFFFLWL